MKKVLLTLMCLAAMMLAGTSIKAQEVTVVLMPGWNWISVPSTDTLDFATALDSFTPAVGDIIQSQWGSASYLANGQWRGTISKFYPGYGYMYKSSRSIPVFLTFNVPQPTPQVVVTTSEPTDITTNSATCGGNVASSSGDYVFVFLKGVCWGTNPNPTFNDNYIEAGNGLGSFTVSLTELVTGSTYYVRAFAVTPTGTFYGEEEIFTTDHEFVDLGLPSGTLWATCNVGADAPEEYGDYFAWGETQPKNVYDWSTYQYCMGSINTLTKYCLSAGWGYNGFSDTLTILLPEDDAATANWGSDWHMPTPEEWVELYSNTTYTWTTQNGVSGGLFTASNGNSIFFPAAGYRNGSSLYTVGNQGCYWNNKLENVMSASTAAFFFYVYSNGAYGYNENRSYGKSVRPVCSDPQNTFIIDVTANPTEGGDVSGGGRIRAGAECTLTATASVGYTFTNWTEDGEVISTEATYVFTVNADRSLVANFIWTGGEHLYVDLGLPSGTLWATCNVGATNPEDYGNYYAWGETQPKDAYDWSTYQYCMGSNNTLTKYCNDASYGYNGFIDNLTTLLPEDDAATANWGTEWHTPTKEEWQELLQNTTETVIWGDEGSFGFIGSLFTASNGNSIFLSTAGFGDACCYMSSSLYTSIPYLAWNFYDGPEKLEGPGVTGGWRSSGRPVRPVRFASQFSSYIIDATANPAEGGVVSGGGSYFEGTECTLTATANEGYTFTNWTENDEVVSVEATYTFTVDADRTLVANFTYNGGNAPTGAINGKFTINEDGDQVYFSQGNLQYQASTDTWKFAENQWDYVGEDNANISQTYDGWIDLFGWGTSGYHNVYDNFNVNFQPYSTSYSTVNTECNYYGYGPSTNMPEPNLTGASSEYDWGVHNAFINGGNQIGMWRTLTIDEWAYVLKLRLASTIGGTSNARFAKATVNGKVGLILFPDIYSHPSFLPYPVQINNENVDFSLNVYVGDAWAALEEVGCVFLPLPGYRYGVSLSDVGLAGYYWSATHYSSAVYNSYCSEAHAVSFGASAVNTYQTFGRYFGMSVRLVAPFEN